MNRLIRRVGSNLVTVKVLVLVGLLLASQASFAQFSGSTGLGNGGWLSSLCSVAGSLQEAVRIFAFVAIIALGLMIMFMELKGWIQDLMKILFGISLALFAASFLSALFPASAATLGACGLG
ncbi:MAG: TrbC/VirB2 family protein [Georgfuchsia sp.]